MPEYFIFQADLDFSYNESFLSHAITERAQNRAHQAFKESNSRKTDYSVS